MAAFDLDRLSAGLSAAELIGPLTEALAHPGATAVVQAPPGSGKTTVVPPVVAGVVPGRVVVTQPRRVAVRSAARRLASLDGSALGERVGFSVRGERLVGAQTRVEFVTPGLLVRRLLADPELAGVDAVVLDEVHERNLDTDLLLALLGDVRALREDLRVVAMSATLDAGGFAALLGDAAVLESPATLFDLAVDWAPAVGPRTDVRGVSRAFLDHVAQTTATAVASSPHDALVFVPGAFEVSRVTERLRELCPMREVLELHGQVGTAQQDRAVAGRLPGEPARVVVSTSLAESSLTVPGVRIVVDSGLAREPRRDAARGMSGLVTVAASRDSAVQRAGRAARLGPGRVVRCYDERTWASMAPHVTPEVLTSDLTELALWLAAWGTPGGAGLAWADEPPAHAMDQAQQVLRTLGAVDATGRLTPLGERLAGLPVDVRWGRALLDAAEVVGTRGACEVVAAAGLRVDGADLSGGVRTLAEGRHPQAAAWKREVARLSRLVDPGGGRSTSGEGRPAVTAAEVVARAWPERLARRVEERTYLLAQGTRAALPEGSPLLGAEWLAVAEVARAEGRQAAGTGAVIRAAVVTDRARAEALAGPLLREVVVADLSSGKVRGRRQVLLGAIELSSTPVRVDPTDGAAAVAQALRQHGLAALVWDAAADEVRRRMAFLHAHQPERWPDVSDAALVECLDAWLAPELDRIARGTPVAQVRLADPLLRLLDWQQRPAFDTAAPTHLLLPSGNRRAVTYPEHDASGPARVETKLQETFGLATSPLLAGTPVQFHLLSPAGRPLAVTDDLESFWNGPYAEVRAEMRGRYPKHPWPEDPWTARATHLTKNRAPS